MVSKSDLQAALDILVAYLEGFDGKAA